MSSNAKSIGDLGSSSGRVLAQQQKHRRPCQRHQHEPHFRENLPVAIPLSPYLSGGVVEHFGPLPRPCLCDFERLLAQALPISLAARLSNDALGIS